MTLDIHTHHLSDIVFIQLLYCWLFTKLFSVSGGMVFLILCSLVQAEHKAYLCFPVPLPSCVTYISNNYLITAFVPKMDQELNIEHLVLTIVLWLCFPHNLPRIYMLT